MASNKKIKITLNVDNSKLIQGIANKTGISANYLLNAILDKIENMNIFLDIRVNENLPIKSIFSRKLK